jgi:hypothetical protein
VNALLDRPGPIDSLKQTDMAVKLQAQLSAVFPGKLRGFFVSEIKGYSDITTFDYYLSGRTVSGSSGMR